jgi:hypothetical protein
MPSSPCQDPTYLFSKKKKGPSLSLKTTATTLSVNKWLGLKLEASL